MAQATGAKFDDYIGENSPAEMQTDLGFARQIAQDGILNYLEGGNEEGDAYPASLGNTLAITARSSSRSMPRRTNTAFRPST